MEKSLEKAGKTIDEAVAAALEILRLDRDSVSVEVLEKPKQGFLGIGGTHAKVRVSYSVGREQRATAFLEGILSRMGISAEVTHTVSDEGNINYTITGENTSSLIGHHGETLDSLQHLLSSVVNTADEPRVRVTLDTENYRKRREDVLTGIATRAAEKAVRTHRNVSLNPMNAYSRHVIHTALQDYPGVTTQSAGSEPNRYVVVCVPGGGNRPLPSGGGKPFNNSNNNNRRNFSR